MGQVSEREATIAERRKLTSRPGSRSLGSSELRDPENSRDVLIVNVEVREVGGELETASDAEGGR